jgi:hypothetical protein
MRSVRRGRNTSAVEVTNISARGFWLLLDDRELFLSFRNFPWFRHATIEQITAVRRPLAHHLSWPRLDVDLDLDSIEHPERHPRISRIPAARAAARPPRSSSTKARHRATG